MKKVTITNTYEGYSESCPFCGKLIEGYSENQVKQRMKVHQMSKKCKEKQK